MTALELAEKIVGCIDAKKGEEIKLLDVHDRTTLCDYFVIASVSAPLSSGPWQMRSMKSSASWASMPAAGKAGKQPTGCCWITKW